MFFHTSLALKSDRISNLEEFNELNNNGLESFGIAYEDVKSRTIYIWFFFKDENKNLLKSSIF